MALEDTNRQISSQNARAANYSASNEASQVVHDTNESLIKSAELAAAWRKLGLTDDEGMALVARQQRINPAASTESVLQSVVNTANQFDNPELDERFGTVFDPRGEKTLNPNAVIEFGKDEADLQTLTAAEQAEQRDTKPRKRAFRAIEARILDSAKDERKKRETPYKRERNGEAVYSDGTPQGYAPPRVLERRIAPQDRLDTGGGQTRATGGSLSATQLALKDMFDRMDAAFTKDPSLRTVPGAMQTYFNLGDMIYPDKGIRNERDEARQTRQDSLPPINSEVAASNASKALTPQEALVLESATRGLERMGEIIVKPTGIGKDTVTEVPRSQISLANMPFATSMVGPQGNIVGYADGDQWLGDANLDSTRPEGIQGLVYDSLYDYNKTDHTYPQVDINRNIQLLEHRLKHGIPTKWGSLQGAPTTIRGIGDLDQALNSVLALAADNNKALMTMPTERGVKPEVSKNPGGREALKQIGYGVPDTQELLNAVAQLQMAENMREGDVTLRPRSAVPITFDSAAQMGDYRIDDSIAPITNQNVRSLMGNLRGNNIQVDPDDIDFGPAQVLASAQQNFSGQQKVIDPKSGAIVNLQMPIGGIPGNNNVRYNKTGIRDLGDLRYALEQQSLRRDARVKIPSPVNSFGEPTVPNVRRQVGKVKPSYEKNITSALLATERANRDERTPKALPAAGESLGSRESAFMAEQLRRSNILEESKRQGAIAALTQPSGRRTLPPGEWVRASDGNVRVIGQGGIPFNRDGAIAVNMNNNKSTSYEAAAQVPVSDPWESTEAQQRVPETQAQPRGALVSQVQPRKRSFGSRITNNKRALAGGLAAGIGGAFTIDALIQNEQNRRQPQEQY